MVDVQGEKGKYGWVGELIQLGLPRCPHHAFPPSESGQGECSQSSSRRWQVGAELKGSHTGLGAGGLACVFWVGAVGRNISVRNHLREGHFQLLPKALWLVAIRDNPGASNSHCQPQAWWDPEVSGLQISKCHSCLLAFRFH